MRVMVRVRVRVRVRFGVRVRARVRFDGVFAEMVTSKGVDFCLRLIVRGEDTRVDAGGLGCVGVRVRVIGGRWEVRV